jgi:hypothetical protein
MIEGKRLITDCLPACLFFGILKGKEIITCGWFNRRNPWPSTPRIDGLAGATKRGSGCAREKP